MTASTGLNRRREGLPVVVDSASQLAGMKQPLYPTSSRGSWSLPVWGIILGAIYVACTSILAGIGLASLFQRQFENRERPTAQVGLEVEEGPLIQVGNFPACACAPVLWHSPKLYDDPRAALQRVLSHTLQMSRRKSWRCVCSTCECAASNLSRLRSGAHRILCLSTYNGYAIGKEKLQTMFTLGLPLAMFEFFVRSRPRACGSFTLPYEVGDLSRRTQEAPASVRPTSLSACPWAVHRRVGCVAVL